jgi:hypothetical protein
MLPLSSLDDGQICALKIDMLDGADSECAHAL